MPSAAGSSKRPCVTEPVESAAIRTSKGLRRASNNCKQRLGRNKGPMRPKHNPRGFTLTVDERTRGGPPFATQPQDGAPGMKAAQSIAQACSRAEPSLPRGDVHDAFTWNSEVPPPGRAVKEAPQDSVEARLPDPATKMRTPALRQPPPKPMAAASTDPSR